MRVREPIQVYLSSEERAQLDRVAHEQGVSRSEALRRALLAHSGAVEPPADLGHITPAAALAGGPPPRKPVALLNELLEELAEDRSDR